MEVGRAAGAEANRELRTKAKPVRPVIPQVPVVFWQVTDVDWPGA
jgi:hypothetical protein